MEESSPLFPDGFPSQLFQKFRFSLISGAGADPDRGSLAVWLLFCCERFSPGNSTGEMSRAVTTVQDKMTHRLGEKLTSDPLMLSES